MMAEVCDTRENTLEEESTFCSLRSIQVDMPNRIGILNYCEEKIRKSKEKIKNHLM